MRLGQTAAIYFFGKLGSSLLGFLATVYFARTLGAGVLGIYFLADAVVSWILLGNKGFNTALFKRLSEGTDKDSFTSAGVFLNISAYAILAIGIYIFRESLNSYIGAPVYDAVILMLGVSVMSAFIGDVMKGEHLVHLQGVQSFLGTLFRSLFQITLVYLGYELVGMLAGYIASTAVVAVLGFVFVLRYVDREVRFVVPEKRHFISMFEYAKFSWLGRLEARTYSWTDLVVLGFFVPSSLVGIYGVCWTLSTVASLFSNALTNTVFPEISKTSAQEGRQKATDYLEESFAYAGLLTIPALVGATVVGNGVLDIYGDEFSQGSIILIFLMAAVLLHSYQKQLLNALNAIDRPDISFRVNIVFIVTNVVLNVVLVYEYGWIGAAVATLISCSVGLLLGYRMVSRVLRFTLPLRRLGYQISAAISMGILVFLLTTVYEWVGIDVNDIVPTIFAVSFGALIYFLLLLLLSADFRKIVRNNSPI